MTKLADRLLDLFVPRTRAAAAGVICLYCSSTYSKYCYEAPRDHITCQSCGTC